MCRLPVLLTALVLGSTNASFAQYPPLRLIVVPAGYIEQVYTRRSERDPNARVFFAGEPLRLRITIDNTGEATEAFLSASSPGFRLRVTDRDGREVIAGSPVIEGPARVFDGNQVPERWSDTILLAPSEGLVWSADIDLSALPPGIYDVCVEVDGRDRNGHPVRPQATGPAIEIRQRTSEAEQEIALREATRLFLRDQLSEAEQATRSLISRFPNSAVAFRMLGLILDVQGRDGDAIEAYEASLEILQKGRDIALLRAGPQTVAQMIAELEQTVARMRSALPRAR